MRIDAQLAKMPAYRARALALAQALSRIDGLVIDPQPPHVNLFHLHLPAPAAAVAKARDLLAALEGAWLAQRIGDAQVPGWSTIELYVGDNLLALDDATVVPLYAKLLAQAQAAP